MNKGLENAFKQNIDEAKKIFIEAYKKEKKEDKRYKEIVISDLSSGTLYISSLEIDLPEILIQEKQSSIVVSYSKESELTFTTSFDKKDLNIEISEENDQYVLKIESKDRLRIIKKDKKNQINEKLIYLIYSYLTFLSIK